MTIFIDTNGEMDFADNERLRFVMHFLQLGSNPDVLEIKNDRFVREDAETSFQEIWLPCATAKQKEIDALKAELEKTQSSGGARGLCSFTKSSNRKDVPSIRTIFSRANVDA